MKEKFRDSYDGQQQEDSKRSKSKRLAKRSIHKKYRRKVKEKINEYDCFTDWLHQR
mgnify:CR=1 FL=1